MKTMKCGMNGREVCKGETPGLEGSHGIVYQLSTKNLVGDRDHFFGTNYDQAFYETNLYGPNGDGK